VELVNIIVLTLVHDLVYAKFCRFLHWLRPTVNPHTYTITHKDVTAVLM